MQLRRIHLVNFRQHADTEFELGPGLTAIIGPNGAGKTTLLEAIAWAIYGNAAARGTRDSIRWSRAPARSPVKVEIEFSLGAHDYLVVRTQREAQLFQDHGASPVSAGTEEVTRVLTRTLGMTRDEFFNTYFTGQKELAVMAALGPAERARFLSRVLGYEKLRLAQEAARAERASVRRVLAELGGLELGLGDAAELERERAHAAKRQADTTALVKRATAARDAAAKALSVEGPEWTRMADLRQSSLAIDGDRRAAEQQVIDARRDHERLDKELAVALAAKAAYEKMKPGLAEVAPLRAELERLDADARGADQHRGLTGQLKEVEAALGKMAARVTETPDPAADAAAREKELGAARKAFVEDQAAAELARAAWVREKEHANTKRQELLQQYEDIEKQRDKIKELGPLSPCPTCGRPLGKEFEQMLNTLNDQLAEVKTNGQFYRDRITQLEVEPADVAAQGKVRLAANAQVDRLTQALAEARSAVKERSELERERVSLEGRVRDIKTKIAALPEKYDVERHDVVRDRLKELEPSIRAQERLAVQSERAATLVSEMEAAEKRLSEREALVKQLTEALAALGFSDERYQAARGRYELANKSAQEAELDLVAQRGDLKAAEAHLAGIAKRIEERAARANRLVELKTNFQLHEELDAAFGELRSDLNAEMRPELSDRASSLLSDLTDGRYTEMELDENYNILILEDGIVKPVISGGEEDVANLALRLAISQLVAERAGQPISLLVLDEIFGSLDEPRRQRVVASLDGLRDRFSQVVLITHIELSGRVDRVLRVALDQAKGAAVVSEEAVGELAG
ncbi:MAG: SMC family ATPase [Gemmatimonadetes bacterium]|nr:SMC family ATPase [Gemmatimonadota bacterium]